MNRLQDIADYLIITFAALIPMGAVFIFIIGLFSLTSPHSCNFQ